MGWFFLILILGFVGGGSALALRALRGLAASLDARAAGGADAPRCTACGYGRAGIEAAATCPECGLTPSQAFEAAQRRRRWHPILLAPLLAGPLGVAMFFAASGLDMPALAVVVYGTLISAPFLVVAGCVWTSGLLRHQRMAIWITALFTLALAGLTLVPYGVVLRAIVSGRPSYAPAVVPFLAAVLLTIGAGWVLAWVAFMIKGAIAGFADDPAVR